MSKAVPSPFPKPDPDEAKKNENQVVKPCGDKAVAQALPEPWIISEEEEYFFYEI